MITITEFNVSTLPQLLTYFIPGYLGIITYRALTSTSNKSEHTLWVSCVISYVVTTLVKVFWPAKIPVIPEVLAAITCIATILCSALFAGATKWNWLSKILAKLFYVNMAPTVFAAHANLKTPGTTVRLYLKDENVCVEGGLSNYSNGTEDPYISLKYYSFRNCDQENPYYRSEEEDQYFIVNLNDVKYIEMWPR